MVGEGKWRGYNALVCLSNYPLNAFFFADARLGGEKGGCQLEASYSPLARNVYPPRRAPRFQGCLESCGSVVIATAGLGPLLGGGLLGVRGKILRKGGLGIDVSVS